MIGVYVIKNSVDSKYYVGSSVDVERRIKAHLSLLKNNKHSNSELQNDYSALGSNSFDSYLLCECIDQNELIEKEQFFIDRYNIRSYNKRSSEIGSTSRNKIKREVLEIKLESKIIRLLEEESRDQNRSVTNLVETWIKEKLDLL